MAGLGRFYDVQARREGLDDLQANADPPTGVTEYEEGRDEPSLWRRHSPRRQALRSLRIGACPRPRPTGRRQVSTGLRRGEGWFPLVRYLT